MENWAIPLVSPTLRYQYPQYKPLLSDTAQHRGLFVKAPSRMEPGHLESSPAKEEAMVRKREAIQMDIQVLSLIRRQALATKLVKLCIKMMYK